MFSLFYSKFLHGWIFGHIHLYVCIVPLSLSRTRDSDSNPVWVNTLHPFSIPPDGICLSWTSICFKTRFMSFQLFLWVWNSWLTESLCSVVYTTVWTPHNYAYLNVVLSVIRGLPIALVHGWSQLWGEVYTHTSLLGCNHLCRWIPMEHSHLRELYPDTPPILSPYLGTKNWLLHFGQMWTPGEKEQFGTKWLQILHCLQVLVGT